MPYLCRNFKKEMRLTYAGVIKIISQTQYPNQFSVVARFKLPLGSELILFVEVPIETAP